MLKPGKFLATPEFKDALSGLRQPLANESPFKNHEWWNMLFTTA